MKYWLLTTEYPPFFGGGIGTYCAFTATMLSEQGFEVTVFIPDPAIRDIQINFQDKIRIIRFSTSRYKTSAFLGYVTNISYEFAQIVKDIIEKEGAPDIIEAQEYQGIAYYLLQYKLLLYSWCRDIPILITAHSPSFLYLEFNQAATFQYPNFWIGEMERFCLQAADQVISPSAYLVKEIKERFAWTNPNISVVANPFNVPDQPASSAAAETDIVFFGKLSAQKGTFKLLSYFDELWKSGFTEKLFLIGGSDIIYHPEKKKMGDVVKKRYRSYIAEGKLIIGRKVPPAAIAAKLGTAKLVIVPSTVDNLPYVVLEMMALGKIVLVSKQGGQAEVVENGIDGFVFDHEIAGSFAIQLKKAIAISDDERARISAAAVKKIKNNYNFSTIFPAKWKIIQQCISGKRGSSFPFIRNAAVNQNLQEVRRSSPLLSIVVPYYNMGRYIDDTMNSLQQSSYTNVEILIINDGSTDAGSLQKLEQYRQLNSVQVLDTENKGLAHARNTGAAQAKGDYLAFLDADDLVHADYYTKAIAILAHYNNVDFVGCWTKYFDASSNTWPTFTPEPPIILFHNTINSSALVYKTESFLSAGLNDEQMPWQGLEDYASVVSLLASGKKGLVLPEILFYYRVREDSMIRNVNLDKKLELTSYIANKHPAFYSIFATDLLELERANGSGMILDNPSLDHNLANQLPFKTKYAQAMIRLMKKNRFVKTIAYKLYRLLNR